MRTSRDLPFNAPYACTGMRESINQLFLTIFLLPIHTQLNPELNQGPAPPGLTHLTYSWRAKQVRKKTKYKPKKCLRTRVYVYQAISPPIIVQYFNLSFHSMFALLHCETSVS